MITTARAFLVGAGTTFIIGSVAFGGGLMFAKRLMEPAPVAPRQSAASQLPPARVVLPTLVEAAAQPAPVVTAQQSVPAPAPEPASGSESQPIQTVQTKEVEPAPEKDQAIERAEHRRAEAESREHRKRTAERKAKRDAARIAKLQERQKRQGDEPRVMAFDGDDVQPRMNNFFGN